MFQNQSKNNKSETNPNRRKLTTADFLEWSQIIFLINQLKKDKDYSILMVVSLGSYLGLRFSDIINLKWDDLVGKESIVITEKKTKKVRRITINNELRTLIDETYHERKSQSEFINVSRTGEPISIQYVNRRLKQIKFKYRLKIQNFSCHTFRKSFGRRVYENNHQSEFSLLLLSSIYGHSSISLTRTYLGLRQEEISNVYLNL